MLARSLRTRSARNGLLVVCVCTLALSDARLILRIEGRKARKHTENVQGSALQSRATHEFTLPRACKRLPCVQRAVKQLEEVGCTRVRYIEFVRVIQARCLRQAGRTASRKNPRFARVTVDHGLSALSALPQVHQNAAANQAGNTTSRAGTEPQLPFQPDAFETIDEGLPPLSLRANTAETAADTFHHSFLSQFSSKCYPAQGAGTHVFVIDTGCRVSHEQIRGRATAYPSPGSAFGDGNDDHGHGTHVAATIAGKDVGVAHRANVTCIKALANSNSGISTDVVSAINHIIALKRQSNAKAHRGRVTTARVSRHGRQHTPFVLSISLGVLAPAHFTEIDAAVNRAANAGIVCVVAAGNMGGDSCSYTPARARRAITVGSLANASSLAPFSNRGQCTSVVAPGSSIQSAHSRSDSAYARSSGTSMSAPIVTGVASLILGEKPYLSPDGVFREMTRRSYLVENIPVVSSSRQCA